MNEHPTLHGTVRGNTIELDGDAGLAEGQAVVVTVRPLQSPGLEEGLRESFGGWADEADDLDEYLEWSREQRKRGRREFEA